MGLAYPFTAIVGQEEMKLALLIAVVDPSVGGVMVFGDRGTGKSTVVRALAALLPPIAATPGCPYHCDPVGDAGRCPAHPVKTPAAAAEMTATPVVDLPLGATEDRIVGALDLESALARGEKRFEPGLLARAHRGFLYIDEVNLLEDHLVDLLLDVAASGENLVEREGLSVRHPARFVLIGSGNPEEGELRPQLLDRFGLSVEVKTPAALDDRVEVVRRRDSFDREPGRFMEAYAEAQSALAEKIVKARKLLPKVSAPDQILVLSARLCLAIGSDGLRGELTLLRASRALAALEGKKTVTADHLKRIAPMALRHRLRRNPLDDVGSTGRVTRAIEEVFAG